MGVVAKPTCTLIGVPGRQESLQQDCKLPQSPPTLHQNSIWENQRWIFPQQGITLKWRQTKWGRGGGLQPTFSAAHQLSRVLQACRISVLTVNGRWQLHRLSDMFTAKFAPANAGEVFFCESFWLLQLSLTYEQKHTGEAKRMHFQHQFIQHPWRNRYVVWRGSNSIHANVPYPIPALQALMSSVTNLRIMPPVPEWHLQPSAPGQVMDSIHSSAPWCNLGVSCGATPGWIWLMLQPTRPHTTWTIASIRDTHHRSQLDLLLLKWKHFACFSQP